MYDTKVICTYNTSEVFLPTDNIGDAEKDFIRGCLYRQELLNVLGIEEFNKNEVNAAIHDLYEKIESYIPLKECMTKLTGSLLSEDLELGLMILYSYDYMYLSHICVSEYLETGSISNENIRNLRAVIF
jgi:hypothetical protein